MNKENLNNLIPSIIGTIIAEIFTLPICTVKTIYQNNSALTITQVVKTNFEKNGLKGFFQASPQGVLSQVISTSTKYTFYNKLKQMRKTEPDDLISNSVNGMIGGVCGSFFSHPIDVWKNYSQRSERFPWKNVQVYYQGYQASIYKNVVLYACLFPIYDFYKTKFNSIVVSSICTTITVSVIIQPFDYYKTLSLAGNKTKINFKNYFRGFELMLARSIPHFIITMWITEKIKEYF